MEIRITKHVIYQRYVQDGINHSDIAKELNVTDCAVRKAIRRYGYKVKCNKRGPKLKDLTGLNFGCYQPLELVGQDKYGRARWRCRCKCGNEKVVSEQSLRQKPLDKCMMCRRVYYGKIHCRYIQNIQNKAKHRHIEFSVPGDYLWEIFQRQNGRCVYSGEPLKLSPNYSRDDIEQTASLDRIDSSKGYVEGNVQWVHKVVNFMKQSLTSDEFVLWCNRISTHCK